MLTAPRVAYLIAPARGQRSSRLVQTLCAGRPEAVVVVVDDDTTAPLLALVRSLRRLLESARFDWLVLLAGDDYPVRPLPVIEAALTEADADALIETVACPRPEIRLGRPVDRYGRRYHYRWSTVPRALQPAARAMSALARPHLELERTAGQVALGVPSKHSPFATPARTPLRLPGRGNPLSSPREHTPFGAGLECYRGPLSCTLSRRAVQTIDRDVRERPELAIYYHDTLHPTESYLHTVLGNDPSIHCSGDTRRLRLDAPIDDGELDRVLDSGADFAGPWDLTALDVVDARVHRS